MAARVFSQQLDRTKPLWELWLVQGLTRKRFALITKTHHALVDGVSGVDIATVLFDTKPVPEPAEPDHEWVPDPEPSSATLAAKGVEGLLAHPGPPGAPPGAGDPAPAGDRAPGRRGRRGSRGDRLGVRQPGAEGAAQRRASARIGASPGFAATWRR